MAKKVTLVELNVYEEMVPLVSGYLQSYACRDEQIKEGFEFRKYVSGVQKSPQAIIEELSADESDIYAFSCYLWNMKLVEKVLNALLKKHPNAYFLLGGPEVMNKTKYLNPEYPKLMICNGEGEQPFANYLKEILTGNPNFSEVKGLSFFQNGELVINESESRLKDLNSIPSPYLNGLFEGNYRMAILETNRGCPFRCGFCFWGAATNDRVFKFDPERSKEEITEISKAGIPFLYIADANWGMLKRDIEISKHIAECNRQYGSPVFIFFSAAKNSPERVTQITEIFTKAGLMNQQPISMQSLNEKTLEYVERKNIKLDAYKTLQDELNEKGISSFIELIWPLPGETLETFKAGMETLMERNAANIMVYPHILLNNTPLSKKREEYQFATKIIDDGIAESEVVVQTAQVTEDDFENGMWFYYSFLALYHTRTVPNLIRYLHENDIMRIADFFSGFTNWAKKHPRTAFTRFCERSIIDAQYYDITNYSMVYFSVLHKKRTEFAELLYGYVSSRDWWTDDHARFLFELDMLNRPFIYGNTSNQKPTRPNEFLKIKDASELSYTIEVDSKYLLKLTEVQKQNLSLESLQKSSAVFRVNHKKGQLLFMKNRSKRSVSDYCNGKIHNIKKIMPTWEEVGAEHSVLS